MTTVVNFPVRPVPGRLVSKKQLAGELGRSTRWVEQRMAEGMPVAPRASAAEHARFDPVMVRAWLDARAGMPRLSAEQRIARLEAEVCRLAAAMKKDVTG